MRVLSALTLIVACLGLAGCGDDLSRTFGITRDAPDEFTVTTRAPLSMPPDFTLRPPRPGAARPQEQTSSQSAEAALAPESALATDAGAMSPGQSALMQAVGGPAPADTRRKVEQEAAMDAPDPSLTDRLMFWRKPQPTGVVVDPTREAARLRQDSALGESPVTGDTPIIQRKSKGLLDGLLGGLL